jgi:hypothetical protein
MADPKGESGGDRYLPVDSPDDPAGSDNCVSHVVLPEVQLCRLAAGHHPPRQAAIGQQGDMTAIVELLHAMASMKPPPAATVPARAAARHVRVPCRWTAHCSERSSNVGPSDAYDTWDGNRTGRRNSAEIARVAPPSAAHRATSHIPWTIGRR